MLRRMTSRPRVPKELPVINNTMCTATPDHCYWACGDLDALCLLDHVVPFGTDRSFIAQDACHVEARFSGDLFRRGSGPDPGLNLAGRHRGASAVRISSGNPH